MEYPCQNWHSLSRLTWKMRKNRVSRNRCNVACSWSWFARSTVSISQQQSSIFAGPVSNATTRRTTPAPAYLRRRNGDDSGSDNHQQRTATHYVAMTRVLPHPGGTCRARGPKSPLPTPGRLAPICRRFRVFDPPQGQGAPNVQPAPSSPAGACCRVCDHQNRFVHRPRSYYGESRLSTPRHRSPLFANLTCSAPKALSLSLSLDIIAGGLLQRGKELARRTLGVWNAFHEIWEMRPVCGKQAGCEHRDVGNM